MPDLQIAIYDVIAKHTETSVLMNLLESKNSYYCVNATVRLTQNTANPEMKQNVAS